MDYLFVDWDCNVFVSGMVVVVKLDYCYEYVEIEVLWIRGRKEG